MILSKKVVLLGPFGVGKTSLFRRYVDNEFSEDYKVTLGVQIKKKSVTLPDGRELSMVLWDTEGHSDNVTDTRRSYLLGSHAMAYVFDLSRPETYSTLLIDLQYLKKEYPKTIFKVIGNKLDLVNKKEITNQLKEQNIPVDALTSAKADKNVQDFFNTLAEDLII